MSLKVTRPNRLTDDETLTSFEDWKNNLTFYLNQDKEFSEFLKETTLWKKSSELVTNRGLADVDKYQALQRFLGLIASLSPPLLYHEIINDTTKITDIFRLLQCYYQFSPSESTFIKYGAIKRDVINGTLERPIHLYLRLRHFIRDNLLLSSGKIRHDGKVPTSNETLSPTVERLIVLRWLEILHPGLPNHVANVFSQDLQTTSLKDLQPRICEQLDDLLIQVENKSDDQTLNSAYTRFNNTKNRFNRRNPFGASNSNSKPTSSNYQKSRINTLPSTYTTKPKFKSCDVCRSLDIPFVGHDLYTCPNIVPGNRSSLLKSFALNVEEDDENEDYSVVHEHVHDNATISMEEKDQTTLEIQRVGIAESPEFNVKLNKVTVSAVLDTGATGSMIQLNICEMAGIKVYPTCHKAVQADGYSHLKVVGEIHTTVVIDDEVELKLNALVVVSLKQSLILGMAFMQEHKLTIDIGNNAVIIRERKIFFNGQHSNPKLSLLRAEVNNVIFPGESITLPVPPNFEKDPDVAIESRDNQSWPYPSIISTKDGLLQIPNDTDKPLRIKVNQVIGQIRSVINQPEISKTNDIPKLKELNKLSVKVESNTQLINIDPDKILTETERLNFSKINEKFSSVFSSNIGCYNGKSGELYPDVLLGKNFPIPKKGKVPMYNSSNNGILQEKFDELVTLGVLKRPQEVGVTVTHTSPSFLVKNPSKGTHRLVTSFVELNKYIKLLPTKLSTTQEVFTAIAKWKYLIKTDLKSAYYQMKIADGAQRWLGTVSPYKGVFVYDKGSMGLRNMAEFLEELMARVMGELITEGIVCKIADDLFIGGSNVNDVQKNWSRCLLKLKENNLTLSAEKTIICPTTTKIVGWIWKNGKLEVDPHKTNPLTVCKPPENVKQMRSFLGGFRVVTCCIPNYSNYVSELEDAVAGKDSSDKVIWSDGLSKAFKSAQTALKNPKTITLPRPEDELFLVSDACNSPAAVGSTLYIKRKEIFHIGGFFSVKLKKHQLLWLPCELEALGINLSINHFSNHIRESKNPTKFLTDSKTCVEAFELLSKGAFSLSPRISSFLMNLNSLNVTISHISGSSIPLTDFNSRNPVECENKSCQLCQFVSEFLHIAVNDITVEQVMNGSLKMPFYNTNSWKDAQKQDPDLRRTYSQLLSGTRPGKKEKDLKDVRHYLQIASISQNGLLVRRKPNPYGRDYELIIVPSNLVHGLLSMLHIRLSHPAKTQLKKLWDRYFFSRNAENLIEDVTKSCSLCNALKPLPRELLVESTSEMPDSIGKMFSADVLRRERQLILVVLEKFSSFLSAIIIPSEKHDDLKQGLVQLISPLMSLYGCSVRVDNAPGFLPLRSDEFLRNLGILIDLTRIKSKNDNPTVDKAIQELEAETKRLLPEGGKLCPSTLATAIRNTNTRIRMNGLSAKEVITKRDAYTNEPINFNDEYLMAYKYSKRTENHKYSEKSKSKGGEPAAKAPVSIGDIVHIKMEGSKHKVRDFYLVMNVDHDLALANLQKFNGNQLRSKVYKVKLSEIYLVPCSWKKEDSLKLREFDNDSSEDEIQMVEDSSNNISNNPVRRSTRSRKPPDRLATEEIGTE